MKTFYVIFLFIIMWPSISLEAKRIKTTTKTAKSKKINYLHSSPEGTWNLYPMDSRLKDENDSLLIYISGFDKPTFSDVESFFLVNNSNFKLAGFSGKFTYFSEDGRMYTSRAITKYVDIPAGETRNITERSWDHQHSFRYLYSPKGSKNVNTFTVKFEPLVYWIYY